jgi:hypothetical protein
MQFSGWYKSLGFNVPSFGDDDSSSSGSTQSSKLGLSGPEYLINDAGQLSPLTGAMTHPGNPGSNNSGPASPPAPTLVGSANGLQFDIVWDASVANAPRGFTQAIIDAAKIYSELFSNKETINIDVGYGEIGGAPMDPLAIGESASAAYVVDYPTVTSALSAQGFNFSASNEPTGSDFLITSAQAKAFGLVDPNAGLDGFVGFSNLTGTGFSWNTSANLAGANVGTGSTQIDLETVALHEISEVMGRLGVEGTLTFAGQPLYTTLDLFNYQSQGTLELSPNGGYFSINNGKTNLGNFNDAAVNGGDIADWASAAAITQSGTLGLLHGFQDSYDAFAFPGVNSQLSVSDIIADAALGYSFKGVGNTALLANYIAGGFGGAAGFAGAPLVAQDTSAPQPPAVTPSHG